MEALQSPSGVAFLWSVLHSVNYLIQVLVARTSVLADLPERVRILGAGPSGTSAASESHSRFFFSLVGFAALFALLAFGVQWNWSDAPDTRKWALEFLVGTVVFSRVPTVLDNLGYLALLRRMLRAPAASGSVMITDQGTVYLVSSGRILEVAVLCGLAFFVTERAFFAGGIYIALLSAAAILGCIRKDRKSALSAASPA